MYIYYKPLGIFLKKNSYIVSKIFLLLEWFFLNNSNQLLERAIILGKYIVDNNATVRACAKEFGISKSTVHKDVTQNLITLQPALYYSVKCVLDKNKSERHIRGGLATKLKYKRLKELKENLQR